MDGQVKIGPEFFAKIKLDYADWRWALVREFLQNCIDAPGCKRISVSVADGGLQHGGTVLTVENDGAPMDRETLTGKLLTLGGSGKNFEGECTGGFGVAKSLLYYCHSSYGIHTGALQVGGCGAQYTVTETMYLAGTRSTVVMPGDESERIKRKVERFAALAQWRGKLTLNGAEIACDLKKGARRRDLGWGIVYTNKSLSGVCVVRLNGQPMFTTSTRYKGCVLVELVGKAMHVLTSNRDGLTGQYSSELQEFLTTLAIDKRSALKEQKAEYKRWRGEVQRNEASKPQVAEQGVAALVNVNLLNEMLATGGSGVGVDPGQGEGYTAVTQLPGSATPAPAAAAVVATLEDADKSVSVGPQFILKNTTGMKTPERFTPGESFSRSSRELVQGWTGILLKLHQLLNIGGEFSVGFVLDEDTEAECERGPYGLVYYINPARIATEPKRKMETRFEQAWKGRFEIICNAVHEFVHGTYNLKEHDEDYACKLTDVMAAAMEHSAELERFCWPTSGEGLPKLAGANAGSRQGPIAKHAGNRTT